MSVVLKLRCPDCAETFRWPGDQKWPEFCPMCRAALSTGTDEIAMPFIGRAAAKAHDKLYRDMERGSELRAQTAADLLGMDVADVSHLKITDMKSGHEGDSAAVPVRNEVSKLMDQTPDATGFQPMGAALSAGTMQGPYANRGANFQTKIRELHAQTGHLVGDNPANEVLAPGYRRRA